MERIRALWENGRFQEALSAIERAEERREFCRHGLAHLLDVARIAWILNLERGCGLDRELVYAAALVHDIGRAAQYATGEPHDEAGERIAAELLDALPGEVGFSAEERDAVLTAVRVHRGADGYTVPAGLTCAGRSMRGRDMTPAPDGENAGGASVPAPADGGPEPLDLAATLAELIREADNRSRACYACPARAECYWPDERKNLSIEI